MTFFLNPSGRLIHFSRATGNLTVLLDKLGLANGAALSPNEDFIVVSELLCSKIVKLWLTPEKFGEFETFAEGLPGTPDNLTPDEHGIWVALPITADPQNPFIVQSMSKMPLVRKFAARMLLLFDLLFTTVDDVFPNDFTKAIANKVLSLDLVLPKKSSRATVLRYDWEGNIIAAYHAYDGGFYTHAMELDGELYLGSLFHSYIAKLKKQNHS